MRRSDGARGRLLRWISTGTGLLLMGCGDVTVSSPEVARVEVSPSAVVLAPGETTPLTARPLDADGLLLSGRSASWSSGDTLVATVSASGVVRAVGTGSTVVRAAVDGVDGTATVTVTEGPRIVLDPSSLGFAMRPGEEVPPPATVAVQNAGGGTLSGLTVEVVTDIPGWLEAELESTEAPTTMQVRVVADDLTPGTYAAEVRVGAQGAAGAAVALPVVLSVEESPPILSAEPTALGFTATLGEGDPAPQEVEVANEGGGTLGGLGVTVEYGEGEPAGWLDVALAGTVAPTTLEIAPRTGDLEEGVYTASVEIASSAAANGSVTVAVSFAVGEPPATDVVVEKEGPATVPATETMTYLVTVRNAGSSLATGVVVQDELPETVTFVEASDGGSLSGSVVTWPALSRLEPGEVVERTVSVRAPPTGTLVNVASATAASPDPEPANNDGSAAASRVETTVEERADLVVRKTAPESAFAGTTITYTIEVENQGPSPAAGVVVTDELPADVEFVSASHSGSHAGGTVTWPGVGSLAAGSTLTRTVTARPTGPGTRVNVAAVTAATVDPDDADNEDSAETEVVARADVVVTKDGPAQVDVGGTIDYTIELANDGPTDAEDVVLRDVLPDGVEFVEASNGGDHSSGVVTWPSEPVLASGSAVTRTLTVRALTPGTRVNVASATTSTPDADPSNNDGSDDASRVSTEVRAVADLSVSLTDSPDPVGAGRSLTYTVGVTNDGPNEATGVVVQMTLPSLLSLGTATPGQGSWDPATGRWTVGTLAAEASATLTLATVVDPTASSSFTAEAAVSGDQHDPDPSDDTATANTSLGPPSAPSDLSATAVSPSEVELEWTDESGNEEGFEVEWRDAPDAPWAGIGIAAADETTFSHEAVAEGTTHRYRVRAVNGAGTSSWSNEATATTSLPAPGSPDATAVAEDRIDVSWSSNSQDQTGFEVQRSTDGGASWPVSQTTGPDVETYADEGLDAGSTYTYRVRALGADTVSDFTDPVSATTDAVPPAPPTDVQAAASSSTSVTVTWMPAGGGEDGFRVEREEAGTWSVVDSVPGSQTSFTHTGVADGTTHRYRVLAFNEGGLSAPAGPAEATTPIPAPADLAVASASPEQVELSWTDVSGSETGFEVQRSGDGGSTWPLADTTAAGAGGYTDGTVDASTGYAYQVRALGPDTVSAFETVDTTTPGAPPAPPPDGEREARQEGGGDRGGSPGRFASAGAPGAKAAAGGARGGAARPVADRSGPVDRPLQQPLPSQRSGRSPPVGGISVQAPAGIRPDGMEPRPGMVRSDRSGGSAEPRTPRGVGT